MKFLVFILIMAGFSASQAQEVVRGIVADSSSLDGLSSVNVQLKNKTSGTTTDANGVFTIIAGRQDTLVFTLVGYESLELPLADYEPGMIRLAEKYTLLQTVTINELKRGANPYEGMFDERNARLKKSIPFYFSKAKKEKIKVQSLKEENIRVQTYVDVIINNPRTKTELMKKYFLSENEYYAILTEFNEQHYRVMYYLTSPELVSLLTTFFESRAGRK